MSVSTEQIREDFDRIALLTERYAHGSDAYHKYLLRRLPGECVNALEIGCGKGAFTRALAQRAVRVTGIDLSPEMIRLARQQSIDHPNIELVTGDVMTLSLLAEGYDCIVSIATLHHLPQGEAIEKMKDALRAGGTLIIHDLISEAGLIEKSISALAYGVSGARRLWKTGRLRAPKEVRDAWTAHGMNETYLTIRQVREICRRHLPGARVRRHLLWRYTIVWRKPASGRSLKDPFR